VSTKEKFSFVVMIICDDAQKLFIAANHLYVFKFVSLFSK